MNKQTQTLTPASKRLVSSVLLENFICTIPLEQAEELNSLTSDIEKETNKLFMLKMDARRIVQNIFKH